MEGRMNLGVPKKRFHEFTLEKGKKTLVNLDLITSTEELYDGKSSIISVDAIPVIVEESYEEVKKILLSI